MKSRGSEDKRVARIQKAAELFRKRLKVLKGVVLQYRLDDLEILDEHVDELRQRGANRQVLLMLGAYFAEILRRNIGGVYEFDEVRQELALKCGGVKCYPIKKVLNAYGTQEKNPLQNYCFMFAKEAAKELL